MKTAARRTRSGQSAKAPDTGLTTFSSDLLTPEEERELLTSFWDCKSELVRVLVRHYPGDGVRITVADPVSNDRVLAVLRTFTNNQRESA